MTKQTDNGVVAGYTQVETCAKRSCPVCGPRINAIRAAELSRILGRNHEDGGGTVLWLRTIPSLGQGDGFTSQARRFCGVWRRYTGHRRYKAMLLRYGVTGMAWGRDDTWSDAIQAAHYHRHGVYLLERPLSDEQLDAFNRESFDLWRDCCRGVGAGAPHEGGNSFEQVREAGALARYITRAVREVSRPDVKSGQSGLSPAQVRERYLRTGDEADLTIMHDWEQSLLDRSCGPSIYFTPGLRGRYGVEEGTNDDAALAAEVEGYTEENAHTFTDDEWHVVQAVPGRTGVLLVLARTQGMDAVREALFVWLLELCGGPVSYRFESTP